MTRTLVAVCVFALVSGVYGWSLLRAQSAQTEQTIDVAAERFSFTPSELKTSVGTTLTIRLSSDDTAHGFRIIGTNVNVEIPKRSRGTVTVSFTPEKAGRYTFECSKLCGAGHDFMRGEIVVADAPGNGQ